ncbi:MAG: hypothetical protein ACXIUB_01070 [Wenzhouxiangella sp.]
MNPQLPSADQFQLDSNGLYLEDSITDTQAGSIKRLRPIDKNGEPDDSRAVEFYGQTQVMTPAGPLPLSFALPGPELSDAIQGYGEAAAQAVAEAVEEIRRLQRDQQSSIMVPGRDGGQSGGSFGAGGGFKL